MRRFFVAIAIAAAYSAPVLASADARSDMAVKYLLAMNPGDHVEQMKKATPPGVKLSTPKWDSSEFATGAYVRLSGKLEGIFVFLTDKQRKQTSEGHYLNMPESDRKYDPASTVEVAMVNLGDAKSKKSTAKIIDALIAKLGKPAKRTYEPEGGPYSGWTVEWDRANKRSITLTEDSEVHLIETFGTPHQP